MASYDTQFLDVDQTLAMHAGRLPASLERIRAEMSFANQLCAAHPDQTEVWQPLILEAGRVLQDCLCKSRVDVAFLTAEAEAVLTPLAKAAKDYALLCVGHAHIDMNWLWSWPETVALTHDTFMTMLTLMDEFPGFIFSQDQASVYAAIEKYNPAMFDQIRRRVKEGRWEVTASQWVEGDKNMAGGESISRHLLYTRAYFAEKFGLAPEDAPIDFEPDTFGHPATLPTILARGGVRYYYHCRGSRGPHLYWWAGPDGSKLLVFNDVQWYMHFSADRSAVAVDATIADPLMDFVQATGLREMPVLYGVGDHGGGPTRRDLRRLIEMDTWPLYPRVEFSTLRRFYEMAEAEVGDIPVITGERNPVFVGCYTSQAWQKEANRHGENLMAAAEAAATLGDCLADVPYPEATLREGWHDLLFDQFHDILPGSGIRATRNYTLGHAQDTQAAAMMARTTALRGLSRRVNTECLRAGFHGEGALRAHKDETESGITMGAGVGNATGMGGESAFSVARSSDRAYLIFNPLAHTRSEIVRVKLWNTQLDPAHLVVTSEGTPPQPVQVMGPGTHAGHGFLEVAFPVVVPALGYRTVCVSDRRVELGLALLEKACLWKGAGGSMRTRQPLAPVLENDQIAVRVDAASGSITSLVDKCSGRDYVRPGEHLGVLQTCLEAYEGMSAWVIGQFTQRDDLLSGGKLTKLHNGPYVQTLRWTRSLGDSSLTLDISLSAIVPRVDFELQVDWREIGSVAGGIPHLKVRFPLDLADPQARFEIPFGSIQRDLFNGEEVPAQRWVDLSEVDGPGMTLVNTSKYGFNVEGTSLNMTLLRASVDPDPLPDLGQHTIIYGVIPHGADWAEGEMTQAAEDVNVPLVATSCDFHEGDLPAVASFVSVAQKNVRLVALKKAQDEDGFIMRLVEVEGKATEVTIVLAPELVGETATATAVDALERPTDAGEAVLVGQTLTVSVPAYGVRAVRVAG